MKLESKERKAVASVTREYDTGYGEPVWYIP